MNVVVGGRQYGKTTTLLKLLKEDSRMVLVTHSEKEAERLRNLAPECKDRIYGVSSRGDPWVLHRKLLIDNVDLVIQQMFPSNRIEAVAFAGNANIYDLWKVRQDLILPPVPDGEKKLP